MSASEKDRPRFYERRQQREERQRMLKRIAELEPIAATVKELHAEVRELGMAYDSSEMLNRETNKAFGAFMQKTYKLLDVQP